MTETIDKPTQMDPSGDVIELCTMLQCLGFNVKSLDTSDPNISQDGGTTSVVIKCGLSGLHVVLESGSTSCTCPPSSHQKSGFWQVSGMAGGKHHDKETGSTVLGSLPKEFRERISRELRDLVGCIRNQNDSMQEANKEREKSASMVELTSPREKTLLKLKAETPSRYRSLDTLMTRPEQGDQMQLKHNDFSTDDVIHKRTMCRRQSTYTLSSTPGSVRRRNKTSSPIQTPQNSMLEGLIDAEKAAEDLRNKLTALIRDLLDDGKNDSSASSLVLDVSKISVMKGTEGSKAFASSPNLSIFGTIHEDSAINRLKRFESASTSNLSPKPTPTDSKPSRLRRLSPNFFKSKKEATKPDKDVTNKSGKLNSLFKPKIITPLRVPRDKPEGSPNLSGSKKKFSHVKSTIPRPTPKKE